MDFFSNTTTWNVFSLKVSVKENVVPTEKNSSRASIFATKARFYFIEFQKALKFFALELKGIEFTAEAPALSQSLYLFGEGKLYV